MGAWWLAVVLPMTSTGASSMVCGASSWLWVSCGPVSRSDRPGLGSTSKAGPEASWLTTVSLCLLSSGALWVTASTVAHPVESLAAPGSQTLGMRRPTGQSQGYACSSRADSASHMCTWCHQHTACAAVCLYVMLSVCVKSEACLNNATATAHGAQLSLTTGYSTHVIASSTHHLYHANDHSLAAC